jgi:hypothetical protein
MGGFGPVSTMANQAIDMSDPRAYIPEKYINRVSNADEIKKISLSMFGCSYP